MIPILQIAEKFKFSGREKCNQILEQRYKNIPTTDTYYKEMILDNVTKDTIVLDAGCGRHLESVKFVASKAKAVIGVDISEDLVSWNGETPGIVTRMDLNNFGVTDESIDVIICRSVFEHLANPEKVLSECARLLRPKGRIIFRTPNLYDYVSLISMITPHRFHQWILNRLLKWDQDDIFLTNYRLNTTHKINQMMKKAGFSCVELKLVSHYPAYLMFSPLIFRIGIAFEELIRKHDIWKQLRGSIVGTFEKN